MITTPVRIAICEDERIVSLDIAKFLERNGYECNGSFDSAEGLLEFLKTVKPDLVLMDIHLKGKLDGIEASSIIFSQYAIPVILLTAYADAATIERAKITQPYAYVLKPYDERELKTAIELGLYRASMERKLRDSEALYRSLFSDGLTAQCLISSDGTISEKNEAFAILAGVGDGNPLFADLLTEPEFREQVDACLSKGTGMPVRETVLSTASGVKKNILIGLTPLSLFSKQSNFLCQAIDITERHELMRQLLQSQKMDALGRLSSSVAHDFNNILTAIIGYARMLETEFPEDSPSLADVDGIIQTANRASTLTRRLLMFARAENSEPVHVSLHELCGDMVQMLSHLLGSDMHLKLESEGFDDNVFIDRSRMEQVVMNLCVNARDAMPGGGIIRVTTGTVCLKEKIMGAVMEIPEGSWVYMSVEDHGTGMDESIVHHVFEPFFTTKSRETGTGLGLSTVLGIVQSAHGYIDLDTKKNSGSKFTVYLPLVKS